jgi:RNA polymerase sigma-70 factor (sigma-E family)
MRVSNDCWVSPSFLLTRDRHSAEDLLQEAFVKVYRRWRDDGVPPHAEAYVRRVMVNAYISGRRRRWSTEVPMAADDLVIAPSGVGSHDPADDRLLVWRALGMLSARQRTVLVLRIYEGLTDQDIAEHLGCAVGTVRSLASRAYLALRANGDLLDRASHATKD